ncbi:MAG: ankyrin repeat domain-containing protein [bacterium]|nr:ankyrin repeat domain-containing protein [bacterium]
MTTQICSICAEVLEVITELNRVEGRLVCWTCLVPNPNEQWKVTVRWAGDFPTVKEIACLRALVPDFGKTTSKELWISLKDKRKVSAGEFYKPHLEQLLARNKKYGLKLDVKSTLEDSPHKPVFQRLLLAIQRNDAEKVSQLAPQVPDINALADDGLDLLSFALEAGCEKAALALVDSGIATANTNSRFTAMQTALENGAYDIIDALLEKKIDLNCKGQDEDSFAIHVLCRGYRSTELLAGFLKNGADPLLVNDEGDTALMILEASLNEDGHDTELEAMIRLLQSVTYETQTQSGGEGRLRKILSYFKKAK